MPKILARILLLVLAGFAVAADAAPAGVVAAETAYLDWLDARSAVSALEEGAFERYQGRDRGEWEAIEGDRRAIFAARLEGLADERLPDAEDRAVAAMRRALETTPVVVAEAGAGGRPACDDAQRRDLDLAALRQALEACFAELGGALEFEGDVVDRGTALQRLHLIEEPARRKALFDAFRPLWFALNGDNSPDSPYRRLVALAAEAGAGNGTEVDAAAQALGLTTAEVERWLLEVLDAWRQSVGPGMVEPWDYRYVHGEALRRLEPRIPAPVLVPVSERFYADLGVDLRRLGVVYDLAARTGKSPYAFADFLQRGRIAQGQWRPSVALVVATYPEGGLFALNELVHELGHAAHISAIRTRPAFLDWPDTLFTEAFADVPSWSIYEPAWQRRYLGGDVPEAMAMRALYSVVMLDVAWGLFELRMLREPAADPNEVWTAITSHYLRIVSHPEVPWWAMRVQLASDPGYMINYGLGAILTAEIRQRTAETIGPFDAGRNDWYAWTSGRLLQFGSEHDTRSLLEQLLGRAVSPAALVGQVRRLSQR
jgi:hypothetical protein